MNKILTIIILLAFVSCKSTYETDKKVPQKAKEFSYVSPVYKYETNTKTLKFFRKYKSYTTKKIDTLFENREKAPSNLVLNGKENEIKYIFETAKKNEPLKLSVNIKKALEETGERYIAFTLLEPKIENKAHVKSCTFEMVLIDVTSNEILFYGESSSDRLGYSNQVARSFKKVYLRIK